jgi:hypothetical protein
MFLYGCETWSRTLKKEEQHEGVWDMMLMRITESKRYEMVEKCIIRSSTLRIHQQIFSGLK